jgi:hypothetical protein
MNLTALWNTMEWVELTFYDLNSTRISSTMLDSLTLRAPNGTILMVSNLPSNPCFWFKKGTYDVLTAYVFGVDSAGVSEQFTTSPNGVARIALQLYTLRFIVSDSIFGSPLEGGTVTITLPNGITRNANVKDGTAAFNSLPEAVYPFAASRDWSVGVSGEVALPSQTITTVGLIVIPSVFVIALGVALALVSFTLVLKRIRNKGRRRSQDESTTIDDATYRDYWNR